MKKIFIFTFVSCICFYSLFLTGCSNENAQQTQPKDEKTLLIYCGITMVHPMREIADIIEKQYNCKIVMLQGGSEDIYQSLKTSKKGDLYLPGSDSYRKKHLNEGMLSDYIFVGYNQAAIIVAEENPKNISADINNLLNPDYAVSIGNPESSSVGKQAKKILVKAGIYKQVLHNVVEIASDSRTMNNLIKEGVVDIILNWKATAYFDENKDKMDAIDLDDSIAPKNKLLLNLTTCTQNRAIALAFMRYAGAEEGQRIFKKYGFLDTVEGARKIEQ